MRATPMWFVKTTRYEAIKLTKTIKANPARETTLRYLNDSLKFVGRFNKDKTFDVNICTLLLNDDIAIAAVPGEPFVQLQLDWKQKVNMPHPFVFGYTWYHGTWANYIPDIVSAARGGYGADQNGPTMIEVGSGEAIMNKHLENVLNLTGLMRETPGPVGWTPGDRWIYMAVPRAK
jgi:neutral ceramidase